MEGMRRGLVVLALLAVGCGGKVVEVIEPPPEYPFDPVDPTPPVDRLPPPAPPQAPSDPAKPSPWSSSLPASTCVSLLMDGEGEHIAFVDLTTGSTTFGPTLSGGSAAGVTSIGVMGKDLWFCGTSAGDRTHRVGRASLVTGAVTMLDAECGAVSASSAGIAVLNGDGQVVSVYADEKALLAGTTTSIERGYWASRVGMSPAGVLASWHSAHEVATPAGALGLDSFDGWIWGVSGASGGRLIVSSPVVLGGRAALLAFDAKTGKSLGKVASVPGTPAYLEGFNGVACGF